MKIERSLIDDPIIYEILYFSPIEVGDERLTNQLYFQTDMYNRTWPQMMVDKLTGQIEHLRHVELGIAPFDAQFKRTHRAAVMFHCKMALAYLDAREARIAMKLCKVAEPATRSTEGRIVKDPASDFDFLRITLLSVLACAARRVKFYQLAVDSLSEAKDIAMRSAGDDNQIHPLMLALTMLNLSAVLGDLDHDEHALRWGLEALTNMYTLFSKGGFPEAVEKYFLVLACHNAALLNVKMTRWDAAVELVNEGVEFTKCLNDADDGLRRKLINIGAQAKHVPENFLEEAVNALNGWGEDCGEWNLSFWDFTEGEIKEMIHVLRHTTTLRRIIIDHFEDDRRHINAAEDTLLAQFILAVVSCQSLQLLTVASHDFDPRKVWRRIKKRSFLETSWYASALNFSNILESAQKPEVAPFRQMLQNMNHFSKKVILNLVVLGNECDGVDLSENQIDIKCVTGLVRALRWKSRLKFTRQVSTLILQSNDLNVETTSELARCWDLATQDELMDEEWASATADSASNAETAMSMDPLAVDKSDPGVVHLDVSHNQGVGDKGLDLLTTGIAKFKPFRVLLADTIGLKAEGCRALERLSSTSLERLDLTSNAIGSAGAEIVCAAMKQCPQLAALRLNDCGIDVAAAEALATLVKEHRRLKDISLNNNKLGSEGVIQFCIGASHSESLTSVGIAYNEIFSEAACQAIGDMMKACARLTSVRLSGNHITAAGAGHIGAALEHSRVLTVYLEDMGFDAAMIDNLLDHGAGESHQLQAMHLNKNPISDRGLSAIAEFLSLGLRELSLSNCALSALSQWHLWNLLSLSPHLATLDLSYNKLGPTGCTDMVKFMTETAKESRSLQSLELGGCGLGDEGFVSLVPVLSSLSFLGVSDNGITCAGLEEVINSNQMIQLRCLDLSKNSIGEQGVHALTERFQQEHKRSLWNPKQLTSSIDQVILKDNNIAPGLAASTEAFLKIHNPLLNVVW